MSHKDYKITKRILRYKDRNNLSYRALAKLLGCESASLHYLLHKSEVSLAFQVVDKFEVLEKKAKKQIEVEDEAWGDS